jgi:hypothetical protein
MIRRIKVVKYLVKLIDGTVYPIDTYIANTKREMDESYGELRKYLDDFSKKQKELKSEDIFDSWEPEPDVEYPKDTQVNTLSDEDRAKIESIEFEVF